MKNLDVPPPDGDLTKTIMEEFSRVTSMDLSNIRRAITGLKEPIYRNEIDAIEDQLNLGKSVILIGDAGTGKSGIGSVLAERGFNQEKCVLFVDARRFADYQSEDYFSKHFHLKGCFTNAVARIGKHKGCRVVFDQFDSVIGRPGADIIAELARNIAKFQGVEVVIVSRKREGHEVKSLNYLLKQGYVELESRPLSVEKSSTLLCDLGSSGDKRNCAIMYKSA